MSDNEKAAAKENNPESVENISSKLESSNLGTDSKAPVKPDDDKEVNEGK